MGDGNLGNYPRCQYLRIYFNPKQRDYLNQVKSLLGEYFSKTPYERYRKDAGVVYLEIAKKNITKLIGFPTGSKIRNKIKIPDWIFDNEDYLKVCLRGLFDTSHNPYLIKDIFIALTKLGFHPYTRRACVELGRMSEVKQFFDIMAPRNQNHYRFNVL